MGKFTKAAKDFAPDASQELQVDVTDTSWFSDEGSTSLKQLDGDTWVDNQGTYRLSGAAAPETTKVTPGRRTVDIKEGELGGEETMIAVNAVLQRGGFNKMIKTGEKDRYGREIVKFTNDRGEDVTQSLYRAGVLKPSRYTSQEMLDAYNQGEAARELGISTGYEDIVKQLEQEINSQKVPTATGMQMFGSAATDPMAYKAGEFSKFRNLHNGVDFIPADRDINNTAHNSLSESAAVGWNGMVEGVYGFGQMLGATMGDDDPEKKNWLEEWGDTGLEAMSVRSAQGADIENLSFDDVNGVMDGLQFLANNAVMSAPYLALNAAGALAAPVTGGLSVAASVGATSSIYAGQIWNEMEGEKDAGAAMAGGVLAGTIDMLGLKGIVRPRQLLTVAGRSKAAQHMVATGAAASLEAAEQTILNATKQQTMAIVRSMGDVARTQADSIINRGNLIREASQGMLRGAISEGITEAGQETIQYVTAAVASDKQFNQWELNDRIRDAIAAGATLGGGFGAAGSVATYAGNDAAIRELQKAELKHLNEIDQIREQLRREGKPIESVEQIRARIQQDVRPWEAENRILQESDQPGKKKKSRIGSFSRRAFSHEKNKRGFGNTLKDIQSIPDALGKLGGGIRKLYQSSSLTAFSPQQLGNASYGQIVRDIRALVGQTRGTINSGRSFEAHYDQLYSQLAQQIYMPEIAKRFGMRDNAWTNQNRLEMSAQMREAAKDGWLEKHLNNEDISDAPKHIRDNILAIAQTAKDLEVAADQLLDIQNQAIIADGGTPVPKLKGWWWKHRGFDPKKVSKNKDAWYAFMTKHTNLDRSTLDEMYDQITGGNVSTVQDFFSHVRGIEFTPGHHMKREANLSEQEGFDAFGQDDMFTGMDNAMRSASRLSTYREFFGSGGKNLDYLFDQLEAAGMPREQVDEMAWYTKSIIDAHGGNFNRIESPRVAELQKFATTWSIFVGLPLSAISSLPESVISAMGLTGGETQKILGQQAKQFGKVFGTNMKNALVEGVESGLNRPVDPADPTRKIDFEEKMLNDAGLFFTPSTAASRLGVGETNIAYQWYQDQFFRLTGITGITQVQRRASAAVTADFVANRLAELSEVSDLTQLNNRQQFAYNQLAELGMDVDTMVDLWKNAANNEKNQLFDYGGEQRGMTDEQAAFVKSQMEDAVYNFVNMRVQNPGAANRPLFFQDPHWAMLTQFNGFISTFTANVVPKLWNDYIKRGTPQVKYNTFALMMGLMAMGGASQYMKDRIKYGRSSPYLDERELIQRALYSSGLLGQAERLVDIAFPLYGSRPHTSADWFIDTIVGESGPTARNIGTIIDIGAGLGDENTSAAQVADRVLKITPFISVTGRLRKSGAEWITGGSASAGFDYYNDL